MTGGAHDVLDSGPHRLADDRSVQERTMSIAAIPVPWRQPLPDARVH
jgi:hypothetical protein